MSFADWVKGIFDRPEGPEPWYYDLNNRMPGVSPASSVRYVRKLFTESKVILGKYSNMQLKRGLWYIIDCGNSNELVSLLDKSIPLQEKLDTIDSISLLYRNCFFERCDSSLSHRGEAKENPLNVLCYMWWDVAPLPATAGKTDNTEMDVACLRVMKNALLLENDACRESALHGLGHAQMYYPAEVAKIVDGFVAANPKIRKELLTYAHAAREGMVQ